MRKLTEIWGAFLDRLGWEHIHFIAGFDKFRSTTAKFGVFHNAGCAGGG
jgi:hypothetical protein